MCTSGQAVAQVQHASGQPMARRQIIAALCVSLGTHCLVGLLFRCKIQNSKIILRHMYEILNLNKIKNQLHDLTVNYETNLINIIRSINCYIKTIINMC